MITFPNAKINLGLNIESKRPDGYHNISTIFYPIPLCDALEILPAKETRLFCYGNKVDCPEEKNLVMKSYRLIAERFGLPKVEFHLYKHIPDGAGLGGGSSDAAAAASLLNVIFQLGLSKSELADIVKSIGADCPFFIYNSPMIAHGIGDELKPFDFSLNGFKIIVIKPETSISTAEAYANVKPHIPETPIENIIKQNIKEWRVNLENDFEQSVFAIYPNLKLIKQSLYDAGAVYASMSGSGSAIFGLFENDKLAETYVNNHKDDNIFYAEL